MARTKHPAETSKQPWEYLLAAGWSALGNPRWESTLWRDPTKPQTDSWEKVPVMMRDGKEDKPLMRPGRVKPSRKEQVFQTVHAPAARPVSMSDALLIQSERDARDPREEETE